MRRIGFKSKKRSVVGETMVHGLSGLSDAASAHREELASSKSEYNKDTIVIADKERPMRAEKQSGLLVLIAGVRSRRGRVALPSSVASQHVCPEPRPHPSSDRCHLQEPARQSTSG
jgi:hypothetical protein